MYLTKVFHHFGEYLSDKAYCTIHPTHRYDRNSCFHMGYPMDDRLQAYHKIIFGQHIYVYSYQTPAEFLPKGYCGPSGIPHNMKPVVDPDIVEDVPPPFGDPMDIDLEASTSQPAHRRALTIVVATATSFEPYLQQITSTLASMDSQLTNMDSHFMASLIQFQQVCHQTAHIDALYDHLHRSSEYLLVRSFQCILFFFL